MNKSLMAVLDFLRRRPVDNNKFDGLYLDEKLSELDQKKDAASSEKLSDGINVALLQQMGVYVPFNRYFDLVITLVITIISVVVRMYHIHYPAQVV